MERMRIKDESGRRQSEQERRARIWFLETERTSRKEFTSLVFCLRVSPALFCLTLLVSHFVMHLLLLFLLGSSLHLPLQCCCLLSLSLSLSLSLFLSGLISCISNQFHSIALCKRDRRPFCDRERDEKGMKNVLWEIPWAVKTGRWIDLRSHVRGKTRSAATLNKVVLRLWRRKIREQDNRNLLLVLLLLFRIFLMNERNNSSETKLQEYIYEVCLSTKSEKILDSALVMN
jgi:hypothetical protein